MSRLAHSKEEILGIYAPDSDEHKFVAMFFEIAMTAPLDALLVLATNRIAAVNGTEIDCKAAEQLEKSTDTLARLGRQVCREHAMTHVDDIKEAMSKGGVEAILDILKSLQDPNRRRES